MARTAAHDDRDDDVTTSLAARVATRADIDLDALARLKGKELTTLLLHTLRARARGRGFVDVLAHAERSAMFSPCDLDGRLLHAIDGAIYAAAADFDVLDLSPVLPLGAVAQTGIDPNNVLSAVRFAEVAADPSLAMALEMALRRRGGVRGPLLRCASLRCLRLQPLKDPTHRPHFRMAALASAVVGGEVEERAALLAQLRVWLRYFTPAHVPRMMALRLGLSDTRLAHDDDGRLAAALEAEILVPLRCEHPAVAVAIDASRTRGLSYYRGPMIDLWLTRDDGVEVNIGDGGATTWLQQLLGQRRERFVATGIGAELIARLFQ